MMLTVPRTSARARIRTRVWYCTVGFVSGISTVTHTIISNPMLINATVSSLQDLMRCIEIKLVNDAVIDVVIELEKESLQSVYDHEDYYEEQY